MKKRLFVYSVDAMVQEDLDYLKNHKHFGPFLEHASGCESIRTIYPSVTYPVHVSIQTGCYPEKTGIFCNNIFTTKGTGVDWCWDSRLIRCENIFTAAKRAGYSTGAAFWPVTAYNKDIDWHLPEYWLAYPGDTFEGTFAEMGSNPEVIRMMQKHSEILPPTYRLTGKANFTVEPNFDDFMMHVACDIIREKAPEVMFIHGSLIDSYRHKNGIFNRQVDAGLDQVDEWFGMLQQAYRDAGVFDETNFVILSDHGQMDLVRIVKPNAYLAERGYIRLDERGEVKDWDCFGIANGMSMTFGLKDPGNKLMHDAVYADLTEMAEDGIYGFSEILTREEARERFRLDGDFSFIAETDGYTSFNDSPTRPFVSNIDLTDYRMGRATHGYMPDKGPQPVFICKGPDFREDVMLPRHEIVDEGPTFAALLGAELKDAQGKAMTELLK